MEEPETMPASDSSVPASRVVRVRMRPYSLPVTAVLCVLAGVMFWALRWSESRVWQESNGAFHRQNLEQALLVLSQYEQEPPAVRWMAGYLTERSIYSCQDGLAVAAARDGYLTPAAREAMAMLAQRFGDHDKAVFWRDGSRQDFFNGAIPRGGEDATVLPPQARGPEIEEILSSAGSALSVSGAARAFWQSVRAFCFQLLLVIVLFPCGMATLRLLAGKSGIQPAPSEAVSAAWQPGVMFGGWLRAEWLLAFSGMALTTLYYLAYLSTSNMLPFSIPAGVKRVAERYLDIHGEIFAGLHGHVLRAFLLLGPVALMARWFAGGWGGLWRLFGTATPGLRRRAIFKAMAGGVWITVVFDLLTTPLFTSLGWLDPRDGWRFGGEPFLAGIVYGCVLAPLTEETIFRGFLFKAFVNRWRPFMAAVVSSLLFAVIHCYSLSGFVQVTILGLLFAGLYHRTGSLWPGMLAHAMINLLLLDLTGGPAVAL